jgi:hypothetical protein
VSAKCDCHTCPGSEPTLFWGHTMSACSKHTVLIFHTQPCGLRPGDLAGRRWRFVSLHVCCVLNDLEPYGRIWCLRSCLHSPLHCIARLVTRTVLLGITLRARCLAHSCRGYWLGLQADHHAGLLSCGKQSSLLPACCSCSRGAQDLVGTRPVACRLLVAVKFVVVVAVRGATC